MLFFIKKLNDWSTLGAVNAIAYDVPLSSDDGSTGTITTIDDLPAEYVGQAITDETGFNVWIIKAIKPSDTETTVTVDDFIEAFDRDVVYDESLNQLTTTAFIRRVILNNFVFPADTEYAIRISPVDGDSTGRIIADLTSDGLFNPAAYIRKIRQNGITVQITSTAYDVVIVFREETFSHNLPFDDGHSQLAVFEQDKNIVAKVTAIKKAGATNYYIQPDGSISTTPPSPRIQGTWNTIIIAEGEESSTTEKVKEEFAKTNDSKKLEFYSDLVFEHGSRVSFFVRGELFSAQISGVSISSTDYRYRYTAGNLPRTLTDKMRKISNQRSNAVISSSGGGGGGDGDKHYVYSQSPAAAVWNIQHNLGKYPSVTVVDSAGSVCVGDVKYTDANNLTITFKGSFKGKAYMN